MEKENIISDKSKAFAIRIIKLYQFLTTEKKEYVLSKQLLRCGTSIGANVKEGIYGQSRPNFHTKLTIALKEAAETEYWLELLFETGYITAEQHNSMANDCNELLKILTAITKKTKASK
ncbi:MAG: four helix bundle protein [Bacteroidetes bacterium]|jgi:four helix bundle protein|nr:four helix bundle protein [Bacteroidota bacterium]